jgi:hypothetical protein
MAPGGFGEAFALRYDAMHNSGAAAQVTLSPLTLFLATGRLRG